MGEFVRGWRAPGVWIEDGDGGSRGLTRFSRGGGESGWLEEK